MSADNVIAVIKFQKYTGKVVWRVFEYTLSGGSDEIAWLMSTDAVEQLYIEMPIETPFQDVYRVAIRMEKAVSICEYGISADPDGTIIVFSDLMTSRKNEGWDEKEYVEITDERYSQLKKNWLIKEVENHA